MASRSTSAARASRTRRLRGRHVTIAALVVVAGIACVLLVASSSSFAPGEAFDQQVARDADAAPLLPVRDAQAERQVYPYSVVPGGVQTPEELARALDDPIVAAHYSTLRIADTRVATIAAPRRAYVSYRIGDRVYWTKKMVALHPGEKILTDGHTEIRARCGNCISSTPQEPTSPDEPATTEFDRAVDDQPEAPPSILADARGDDFGAPVASPLADSEPAFGSLGPLAPAASSSSPDGGGGPWAPSVGFGGMAGENLFTRDEMPHSMPLVSEEGENQTPEDPPDLTPPGVTPPNDGPPDFPPSETPPGDPPPGDPDDHSQQPAPIPEPGSILLLGTGLAGYGLRAWRNRRRRH